MGWPWLSHIFTGWIVNHLPVHIQHTTLLSKGDTLRPWKANEYKLLSVNVGGDSNLIILRKRIRTSHKDPHLTEFNINASHWRFASKWRTAHHLRVFSRVADTVANREMYARASDQVTRTSLQQRLQDVWILHMWET